jgi:hypothetical protein
MLLGDGDESLEVLVSSASAICLSEVDASGVEVVRQVDSVAGTFLSDERPDLVDWETSTYFRDLNEDNVMAYAQISLVLIILPSRLKRRVRHIMDVDSEMLSALVLKG